jgi:S-adenosylmethionine decarboxylase
MSEFSTAGKHVMADLFGVNPELLIDADFGLKTLLDGAEKCGATVLNHCVHIFDNGAYTITVTLAESHISAHAYYEHGTIMTDFYCCGNSDPVIGMNHIIESYKPSKVNMKVVTRGTERIEEIG